MYYDIDGFITMKEECCYPAIATTEARSSIKILYN